jgi:hypothetical protein
MANPEPLEPTRAPSFDDIQAQLQADPSIVRPGEQTVPEQPFFDAGDALLAVPRGGVDAVQGVYGLADALSGDNLPNWRTNPLGESSSTVGRMLEGITNFAAGFIPVAGVLGKVGKVGTLLDITKGAETAAEAAGLVSKARAIGIGRSLAAGAITDFAVWDGHQERLSNLIQDNPALANPITEFLASKSSDSQVVGRLKGALEGLGMGAMAESLILGLKALKAARGARAAGAAIEDVNAAAAAAAPEGDVKRAYLDGLAGEPHAEPAPAEPVEGGPQATAEAPQGVPAQGAPEGVQGAPSEPGSTPTAPEAQPVQPGPEAPPKSLTMLRNLGIDEDKLRLISDTLERRTADTAEAAQGALGERLDPDYMAPGANWSATNPRALMATERLAMSIDPSWMNLEHFETPTGVTELLRTGEELFLDQMKRDIPNLNPKTLQSVYDDGLKMATSLTGAASEQAFQGKVLSELSGLLEPLPEAAAKIQSYNFILEATARKAADLMQNASDILAGSTAGDANRALVDTVNQLQFMYAVQAGVKGAKAEIARTLGSFKLPVGGLNIPDFVAKLGDTPEAIQAAIDRMGGNKALQAQLARELLAWGDGGTKGVAALHAIARGTVGQRLLAMTNEYWVNSILAGLKTQVVTLLGPLLNSVYRPIEIATGGAIQAAAAAVRGNPEVVAKQSDVVKQAVSQLMGLWEAAPQAWAAVKSMGIGGDGIFSPGSSFLDQQGRRPAITAANAGFDDSSVAGQAVNWLGSIVRLPTGLLGTAHDFAKQMNYRTFAAGELVKEATGKGILDAAGQAQYVADEMDKLIFDNQAYSARQVWNRGVAEARAQGITNPMDLRAAATDYVKSKVDSGEFARLNGLSQNAMRYGQDVSFTTPADPGTASYSVQQLLTNMPYLKFIMPFVNTPMNLLKFTGQRLDVFGAARAMAATVFPDYATSLADSNNRFIQDFLSRDPRRIADATGRIAFGTSIGAFIASKAADGSITGRGPLDPEQRSVMLDAGWQPYSVKVDNGYVSYARLDPFATLIGTMADIMDYNRFSHPEDQGDIETLGKGLLVAMANNFTNKSYLAGISNFVQVLQDPTRQLPKFLERYAGSFVPNIAGQSVLSVGDDENMRDVRGMLDAMVAKTPGLSQTLEPQRNVLGEPLERVKALGTDTVGRWVDMFNPIAYREVSDNVIKQEMYQLGHAFTPPKKTVNGVDLTGVTLPSGQTAYDRWSQLHGEVRVDGMTLQDNLRRTIKSQEYQRLSPLSENGLDSPRIGIINSAIQEYRAAAYQQLLKEAPTLAAQDQQFRLTKRQLRSGIDNRIIPQQ